MKEPQFDDAFWANVRQRAAVVRERAITELDQAEQLLLAEVSEAVTAADATVLPVFTEPFWEEVGQRAEKVKQLTLSSLAEAEERLAGPEIATQTVLKPAGLRAYLRNLPLQRSDAFGFVAALLAVVFLVPQLIAPVMSSAGVEPPKIVQFLIIGDDENSDVPGKVAGEAGSSSDSKKPGTPPKSDRTGNAKVPTPAGSNASDGIDGTSKGTTGTPGAAVNGTPAPSQSGSTNPGTTVVSPSPEKPSPEPSPTPARPPAAPSGLEAVAIDATTIRLSWIDNSTDESVFQIHRLGVESPTPAYHSVLKDVTTYLWTNVAPETQACFRIRALNDALSDWAPSGAPGQVCATTPAAQVEPAPAAPPATPAAATTAP